MRVGLDGYPLAEPRTGVGHYTLELARALAANSQSDRFELISPAPLDPAVLQELDHARLTNLCVTNPRSNSMRRRWWAVGLPLYARRGSFDLFHGTNFEVPLWNSRRNVVTLHDLSVMLHPQTHRSRLVRRARRRLPLSVKLADRIITPTESVRREVCEYLGVEPAKVTAVHSAPRAGFQPMPAAESARIRNQLGVEDEFLLFVGTLEPRKNLPTLLKAFEKVLCDTTWRPQLVIAGGEGWLMDEFLASLKDSVDSKRVRLTGYLPDTHLCALYSSCRVFIYPSVYEGFGFPPLEAMACGAAVIASRIEALQETLGGAACFIDPLDAEALAANIVELLEDEARRMEISSKGRQQASSFSWDATARRTLDVYREVMSLKK